MKSFGRLLVVGIISLAVVAVVSSPLVRADDGLTDEQKQRIQTNCQSIKTIISQLRVSDTLLRVNRGQLYESIASKLMDRFNSRLASNSINADNFTTVTVNYRTTLSRFRADYQAYAQQLSKVLTIDCQKNPQSFHDSLVSARELRKTVHSDVTALNTSITNYQTSVNEFLQSYKQVANGVID